MDVNGGDINKSGAKNSKPKAIIRSLDWDDYLKFCDGNPAPAEFFNHHIEPPLNEFQINQKLEVTSPDSRDFVHLATVVGFMGPRLQLRLDGCDNSNDFFELVDSDAISPIGSYKLKNRYFAAPLRFRKDAATYTAFCRQILKNAVSAPKQCFKTPPKRPAKNYFEPGMKLEAVDIKHPSNICPATIKNVENHLVEIHLDGWEQTNDYKCSYFSRNLFPVGWCKKTGHILQFPGPKAEYEDTSKPECSINAINDENTNMNSNHLNNDKAINVSTANEQQQQKSMKLDSVTSENDVTISSHILPVDLYKKETSTMSTATSYRNSIASNDININSPLIVDKAKLNASFTNNTNNSENKNNIINNNHMVVSSRAVVPNVVRGIKRPFDPITAAAAPEKSFDKSIKSVVNGKKLSLVEQYQSVLPSKHVVNSWSVEELMEFLNLRFPDFNKFEHQFRSEEIDGKAFLMLTNDLIMKFMNIKLGYSLKIIDLIEKINSEPTC